MYGKIFASAFTGSMYGAGPTTFAVWAYVIANTADSQVELNPVLLASALGTTPDAIADAIGFLCAPDTRSRSKVEGGRRLVREGEYAYRVPNFSAYRAIRNEEDRREYNRVKKAEQRERERGVKAPVIDCQRMSTMSAKAETETEAEAETTKPAGAGRVRVTWLTPYADAWQATCGGKMPMGPASKALRPLHDQHGAGQVLDHWKAYLAATDPAYASPTRFAATYGRWDGASPTPGVKLGRIEQGRENMASWLADKEAENGATIDCGDDILPGGF